MIALRCAVCGAEVDEAAAFPFRCPDATASDRRHVLHRVRSDGPFNRTFDDPNPFLRWAEHLLWWRFAAAHGMDEEHRVDLVRVLDAEIGLVCGTGFRVTPVREANVLGLQVLAKDETGNVSGSHKARHLMGTMLHLLVAEALELPWPSAGDGRRVAAAGTVGSTRPTLAIASCGNAALGAAVVAAAARWPLQVFVPPGASPAVVERLRALRADVTFCPRRPSDPPGDPCVHRFREAVGAGALPFGVQGTENALALDGGRTIGWELAELTGPVADRVFVQIGGGALATGIGQGEVDTGVHPCLHAVQAAGCAPLARAWDAATGLPAAELGRHWADLMWPWESEPVSIAGGILDDETYDWLGVVLALRDGGGWPIVVSEAQLEDANRLAVEVIGVDADHTGSAGLAGLLALRDDLPDDDVSVVVLSGARRA